MLNSIIINELCGHTRPHRDNLTVLYNRRANDAKNAEESMPL